MRSYVETERVHYLDDIVAVSQSVSTLILTATRLVKRVLAALPSHWTVSTGLVSTAAELSLAQAYWEETNNYSNRTSEEVSSLLSLDGLYSKPFPPEHSALAQAYSWDANKYS